jgi:hypothetical protein
LNTCPFERMCLQQITVDQVIDALELQVDRHGAPLECDSDTITPELIERNALRHEEAVAAHQAAWSALYR